MLENLREPDSAKERLASGEKPQESRKSEQDQNASIKPIETMTRATLEQTAGAVWTYVWTMPTLRKPLWWTAQTWQAGTGERVPWAAMMATRRTTAEKHHGSSGGADVAPRV